ncbi:MAG: S24/S26 family peptidase [Firmicutes bacterium]|nr:S24/S26 family peptidase [Bacillota bacterium]
MNEADVRKEDSCGELSKEMVSGDTTAEKPGNKAISYEAFLDRHGRLTYTNVGVSMLPLLRQGRDLFTVEKKTADRCQVGDVVLYRRPPDQYVLRRIIEVRAEDYVILGDNCVRKETGIRDEDILAVLTGFVRKGKEYTVRDRAYCAYTFFWLHTIALRVFLKRAGGLVKRGGRVVRNWARLRE